MKTTGRYEIREILGEGGMGVVYRAFDPVMAREVTLKTLRNPQDRTALDLFKKECAVLASMAHPNIVEIYDVGETDESGGKRPYFVMPLLRGATLDLLIKSSSTRLTIERSINIVSQICRGLQAAHDQGLVHRDLKPSNIFILEDDSVKIIDFGVAHLIDQRTVTGLKGTLAYMAPEQLLMKQPTPLSDQFSIAVLCYEMLAHRNPYKVPGYKDLTQAILNHSPTPISDVNQAVNPIISQVVHKALAKEPVHRFADVREFGDCLQKAMRNEFMSIFDPAKIEPRLDRVRKAMAAGDFEFADEIMRELQSESYLNPEIDRLRKEIDETRRSKTVGQLLDTAKRRFAEEEYLLALQKVHEVLEIEPSNTEAFTLKAAIEAKRSTVQSESALRLAQQHLENRSYDLARQAAEKVLQLRPKDARAQTLLAEANRREQESGRIRQEKDKAYQAAVQSFEQGDVSSALSKIERVLELDRRSPESTKPEQSASYQTLYEKVRSKRDLLDAQYVEAKRYAAEGNLTGALAICEEVLAQYPKNVIFQALKFDVEEARREEISTYIAKVEKEVAAEPDLNRKVSILEDAKQRYPGEERFRQSLERFRSRRDLVQSIAARAATAEDSGQFADALGQWEIMRNTNPQYPGLEVEIERVKRRREQQSRTDAKSQWVAQIDQALGINDFARACALTEDALAEFRNDSELLSLKKTAQQGLRRGEEANRTLTEGQDLLADGKIDEGFAALRQAVKLDPTSQHARNRLVEELLRRARNILDSDWRSAEPLVLEAQEYDQSNPLAKSLRTLIKDSHESEETTSALSKARELQAEGDLLGAIAAIDAALPKYPGKERLVQLRTALVSSLPQSERENLRAKDLQELKRLAELSQKADDPKDLESIFAQTRVYSSEYASDNEFSKPLTIIQQRVRTQGNAAGRGKPDIPPDVQVLDKPATPPKAEKQNQRSPRVALESLPLLYKTWWGRGALVLVAVVILILLWPRKSKIQEQSLKTPAAALVRVTLSGTTGDAHVKNSSGEDVTLKLATGVPAGGPYWLTDSKIGFRDIKQRFNFDASTGTAQTITAKWEPLSTTLQIGSGPNTASNPGGQWTLDGTPLQADQLSKIDIPRADAHELIWSDSKSGLQAKLPFTVTDGYANLGSWQGPWSGVGAIAVAVRHDDVQLRPLQMKIRYTAGSAAPQEAQADGQLLWQPATEDVTLQSLWDLPTLGTIEHHDPKEGGFIYVALLRRTVEPQPTSTPPDELSEIKRLMAQKRNIAAYARVLRFLQANPNNTEALNHKKTLETIQRVDPDQWK